MGQTRNSLNSTHNAYKTNMNPRFYTIAKKTKMKYDFDVATHMNYDVASFFIVVFDPHKILK